MRIKILTTTSNCGTKSGKVLPLLRMQHLSKNVGTTKLPAPQVSVNPANYDINIDNKY